MTWNYFASFGHYFIKHRGPSLFLFMAGCLNTTSVQAFYEKHGDDSSVEISGMARGFGMAYQTADKTSDAGVAGLARLILQAQSGENLNFELNAYQTYIPASLVSTQGGIGTPLDVERSASLEWSFSTDNYMHLAIDQMNLHLAYKRTDITLGRQPINLATTFYFTPNDFFAPFSAQTFYRVYKPGVDALRLEASLGPLSQLSYMQVLGYAADTESATGWSNNPDNNRRSDIAKYSTVSGNFEWAILGGDVRHRSVIGGSLQGELFDWLGLRAEVHRATPDNPLQPAYNEVSIGIEHRWENSLDIRLEYFHHGSGANSVNEYAAVLPTLVGESSYLARRYTAVGIGYQFTPLFTGQCAAITNWVDDSWLLSLNGIYSLADESELSINLGIPIGDAPVGVQMESEFGSYPYSVNVEVRGYF